MPSVSLALAGFAVALLVTGWTTPLVRRFALSRTWTDRPDGLRKLHASPTPSAGGLAIFAGIAASLAAVAAGAHVLGVPFPALHPFVYLGALLIVATGAYDDIHGLPFKPKLLVEGVVAYALVHAGYRIDLSALPFVGGDLYAEALYALPLTMLWIVGVINAVNLVDGVDGLAAGIAAIAIGSLAVAFGLGGAAPLVFVAICVVGALVGFLVHNFNPASIFMGDSGSLLLGYVLAVYALSGPTTPGPVLTPLVPLLALGLPLLDTTVAMARRLAERRAIFAPDADHIHHRMVTRFSTRGAVLALYGVAGVFGTAAVVVSRSALGPGLWITAGTLGAAFAFISLLGYVRRPYAQPVLRLIGGPQPLDDAPGTQAPAPTPPPPAFSPSGDGSDATTLPPSTDAGGPSARRREETEWGDSPLSIRPSA